MAIRNYKGQLAVPATTATKLLTLLVAQDFTLTPIASEITIVAGADDIKIGHSSSAAATGRLLEAGQTHTERAEGSGIDLTQFWFYCAASTTIYVDVRGK